MCYHKSPPNIAPFPATYHPQISPYAEYMTFGRLPANASFPAAAKSLNTAATLFAGPGKASNSTPSVSGNASFHLVIEGDMQTLSTQNAPKDGPVQGILFVPSLELNDPCNNITAPYIPANVTRYQDVSSHGYQTIGLAPWITSNCSKPFLDASSRVGTEALVFFLPVRDDAKPPPPDDPTWLLSGGASLESDYPYPVYAIPGSAGVTLFEQLSRYPSNETFPQSQQNASSRGDGGYVRLYTFIDLEKSEKKTPSIWGFLLAIIGTVVVLSVILLLLYQFLQRRRREILQRRLAVGAADYQQFQLQHLKVPQELIARLPTYVYPNVKNHGEDCSLHTSYDNNIPDRVDNAKRGEDKQKEDEKEPEVEADGRITQHKNSAGFQGALDAEQEFKTPQERVKDISPRPARCETSSPAAFESDIPDANHPTQLSHSQTTCAICLDDFTPNSSIVRELPCGHIYHPECIDISLTRSSSLCPLCKKSVWAPEFYPIPTPQATHRHDNVRHPWLMTQM